MGTVRTLKLSVVPTFWVQSVEACKVLIRKMMEDAGGGGNWQPPYLPMGKQALVIIAPDGRTTFETPHFAVHAGSLELFDELKLYISTRAKSDGHVDLTPVMMGSDNWDSLHLKDVPAHFDTVLDLEWFAARVHLLWMDWANALLDEENISPERMRRWMSYMVPYADLPEEAKEMDRHAARLLMDLPNSTEAKEA